MGLVPQRSCWRKTRKYCEDFLQGDGSLCAWPASRDGIHDAGGKKGLIPRELQRRFTTVDYNRDAFSIFACMGQYSSGAWDVGDLLTDEVE